MNLNMFKNTKKQTCHVENSSSVFLSQKKTLLYHMFFLVYIAASKIDE